MGGESVHGEEGAAAPALQVIVLGSGGGPIESNTTAFLVRSLSSGWRKGSIIALDAGVQLSAITRILEQTQPLGLGKSDELSLPHTLTSGPFTGLELPFASAAANAAHVQRTLIDTYLITHPHLDHISGFVVNTAGLPGTRPKRLAGLPSTIAAFKTHIFNNVIWPNLTDENNGAGLVTYMRLVEGGSPALGEGDGKGYMEISDGLAVKVWGVSHGHCIEKHSHRGSGSSTRYGSIDAASVAMGPAGVGMGGNIPLMSPRSAPLQQGAMNPSLSLVLQQQRDQLHLASTPQGVLAGSSAPSGGQRAGSVSAPGAPAETVCVYDSSAYFIRDVATGREILMFGDVEPDSISLSPRNQQIWQEAAPKMAGGKLAAIFIECSYDDSQSVDRLFGHLAPRFVIQEMANLAEEVRMAIFDKEATSDAYNRKWARQFPRRSKSNPESHWDVRY
ncbi:cAMP phosphodiesterases class-II-domain-containing protein [Coniochaeta sp. 2T2.1]|nr:cAMP phosphodiesterases class-II-domain-containing protein [Coniochaeta sp. 2T2.1]